MNKNIYEWLYVKNILDKSQAGFYFFMNISSLIFKFLSYISGRKTSTRGNADETSIQNFSRGCCQPALS